MKIRNLTLGEENDLAYFSVIPIDADIQPKGTRVFDKNSQFDFDKWIQEKVL